MKTGTMLLIGAGVVASGVGVAWWFRAKKAESQEGDDKTGKAALGAGLKARQGKRTNPKSGKKEPSKPPATKASPPDVFVLSAAEAKAMACDLRGAQNVRDVEAVLDVLLRKIEDSGASQVDLRSSGLTDAKVPVAQFEREASELVRWMRLLPPFMWKQARSRIEKTLSGLPDCDAPMDQWAAMFGEGRGVQAAVRPPPFTLLQGIRPLAG